MNAISWDPFPADRPLDVTALSRVVQAFIWNRLRYIEGIPPTFWRELDDLIVLAVKQFDEGRTEHLKFLKTRLMELLNITIQPVMRKTPEE